VLIERVYLSCMVSVGRINVSSLIVIVTWTSELVVEVEAQPNTEEIYQLIIFCTRGWCPDWMVKTIWQGSAFTFSPFGSEEKLSGLGQIV
jgi:hypothetical protein